MYLWIRNGFVCARYEIVFIDTLYCQDYDDSRKTSHSIHFCFADTVNATVDLPSELLITVSPSLPRLASTGVVRVYDHVVDDVCGSNSTTLNPPAGADATYSCPSAGLYNFHTTYTLWGNTSAWYSSFYGFNIGVVVQIVDTEDDEVFARCVGELMVQQGPEGSSTTGAAFLGGIAAGLTGLTAGYMFRKRRIGMIELDPSEESPGNHFELITDPASRV
jgi:hypothetical protein